MLNDNVELVSLVCCRCLFVLFVYVFTFLYRYQEEEQERQEVLARQQKEEEERRRRQQLEEEASMRDQLVKKVHQLEHRKLEIQRELLLRSLSSSGPRGSQLRSAVVVVPSENKETR